MSARLAAAYDLLSRLPVRQPVPVPLAASRLVLDRLGGIGASLPPGVTRSEVAVAGPAGELRCVVIRPPGTGPFPVVVSAHGGGFVTGTPETHQYAAGRLCADVHAVVVVPEYRRAPEARYPAAHDDVLAATRWAASGGTDTVGGDATRLALTGDSAGGSLALATALACQDDGGAVAAVLLLYPWLLFDLSGATLARWGEQDLVIPRRRMQSFHDAYTDADGRADETLTFTRTPLGVLGGLPPTCFVTGARDTLRSDTDDVAARLAEAGVDTEVHLFAGMPHAFAHIPWLAEGRRALRVGAAFLRTHLRSAEEHR